MPPLAVCLLALAAPALAQDGDAPQSPEAQVFSRVCGKCHSAQAVTVARKTQAQWEESFFKMIDEQGAKASDEDFRAAFDYVVRNFGRVNVDPATTNELTTVLGWSKREPTPSSITAMHTANLRISTPWPRFRASTPQRFRPLKKRLRSEAEMRMGTCGDSLSSLSSSP